MARGKRRRPGGSRWVQGMLGAGVTVLVLIVAGVFGLWLWLKAFLHGEGFRQLVSSKTSEVFRADGSFESFDWTGSSAYTEGFSARGYEDASFSMVDAKGIRAFVDFGSVRRGVWELSEVHLNQLTLVVDGGRRLPRPAGEGDGPEEGVAESASGPGFFDSLVPQTVEIGRLEIAEANLLVDRGPQNRIDVRGIEASLRPVSGSDTWSVSGRGGTIAIPGLPDLEIETFATRLKGSELFITDAAANFLDGAELTASGEMRFDAGSEMNLKLRFSQLDAHQVVSERWKERLSGMLDGEIEVTGPPGDPAAMRSRGRVTLRKGVLEAVGVLDKIADYAKAEKFRRLVLNEAWADFENRDGRLEVKEMVLQSDGLTRITGELTIEDGRLTGIFEVGITPGTLKWVPGAEQKVFSDPEDGFLWTHMNVSGTLESPSEDLSARLAQAAVEAVVESVTKDATDAAEALKNPDQLLKSAADALGMEKEELEKKGKELLEDLKKLFQ